jgi:hypothetical protein
MSVLPSSLFNIFPFPFPVREGDFSVNRRGGKNCSVHFPFSNCGREMEMEEKIERVRETEIVSEMFMEVICFGAPRLFTCQSPYNLSVLYNVHGGNGNTLNTTAKFKDKKSPFL